MKTFQKLVAFTLTLVFIFSPLARVPLELPVFAAEATSGTTGDCTWKLDGSVLTISGNGAMDDYSYVYTSQNGFTTTAPWGSSITEVIIENGATSVGSYAFCYCTSLVAVTIPDSVTSIGDFAFLECSVLANIDISNGVTSIGSSAFSGCTSLASITIPSSVTSIGDSAFRECTALTSVNILDGVTSIGESVFIWCTKLDSINIPDSVKTIGRSAFSYCKALVSINIPDSVTSVGDSAFRSCTSLATVTDFGSVTSIPDYTFYDCSALSSITIPDSVTTIGSYAFYNCSALTSINIPNNVVTIGAVAFGVCTSLTDVWYQGTQAEKDEMYIGIDSNNSCLTSATWHHTDDIEDVIVAPQYARLVLNQYLGLKFYFDKADIGEDLNYKILLGDEEKALAVGTFSDLTEEDGLYVLTFNGIGISDFFTEFSFFFNGARNTGIEPYNTVYKLASIGEAYYEDGSREDTLFKSIADLGRVVNGNDAEFGLSYKEITPASSGQGAEEGAKIRFIGKNLVMHDAIGIRLYGVCENASDIKGMKITLDGKYNVTSRCDISEPIYDEEKGKYAFTVDVYFSVSKMEGEFTLDITDGEGKRCLSLFDRVDWVAQTIINKEGDNALAKQVLIYIQSINDFVRREDAVITPSEPGTETELGGKVEL